MSQQPRTYRYYDFMMVAFVVVLVCSNLIGPAKAAQLDLPLIGAVTFGAGVLARNGAAATGRRRHHLVRVPRAR